MGTACNSLQPPHRTAEGGKRTKAQGAGACPFRTGGSGSGGRRSGARPAGTRRSSRCHVTQARGSRRESPSDRFLLQLARPAASPPSALKAARNTVQFLHKSEGEGEREAAAEGREERGKLQRLRTASQRRPALHQTRGCRVHRRPRGRAQPGQAREGTEGRREGGCPLCGGRIPPLLPLQTGLPIHSPAAGQLHKKGATLPETAGAAVHRD